MEPDILISCIGGGGLVSGLSQALSSHTTIIGAEPKGAASMWHAIQNKKPTNIAQIDTFVDGASVQKIGKLNFDICQNVFTNPNHIKLISNEHICHELINFYQDDGIILEPGSVICMCSR